MKFSPSVLLEFAEAAMLPRLAFSWQFYPPLDVHPYAWQEVKSLQRRSERIARQLIWC